MNVIAVQAHFLGNAYFGLVDLWLAWRAAAGLGMVCGAFAARYDLDS